MSTTRLSDTILDSVSPVYYSEPFQSMLENHIFTLARHSGAQVIPIEPSHAYQYEGDFFGLLTSLGVPSQYHWTTMRCNGYYSPVDFRSDVVSITQPPFEQIDELQAIYTSSSSLSIG